MVHLRAVAREQVNVTGLMLRPAGVTLVLAFTAAACVGLSMANRARQVNVMHPHTAVVNFAYSPVSSLVMVVLAFLLPLVIWQDEDPTRRVYHWAMPIGRAEHGIVKVTAGWVWLMVATAIFVLFVAVVDAAASRISGNPLPRDQSFQVWEWLIPFTSVTVAYLFSSAAALGTRTPLIWLGAVVAGYVVLRLLGHALEYHELEELMETITSGKFGLEAAMAGMIDGASLTSPVTIGPSLVRWIGATALWSAAGAIAVVLCARLAPREK
jgi:hypothetical protein